MAITRTTPYNAEWHHNIPDNFRYLWNLNRGNQKLDESWNKKIFISWRDNYCTELSEEYRKELKEQYPWLDSHKDDGDDLYLMIAADIDDQLNTEFENLGYI